MNKKFIFVVVLMALAVFLYMTNKVDYSGWIQTEELKDVQHRFEKNGYLTKEDLTEIERIHNQQLDLIKEKTKLQNN